MELMVTGWHKTRLESKYYNLKLLNFLENFNFLVLYINFLVLHTSTPLLQAITLDRYPVRYYYERDIE